MKMEWMGIVSANNNNRLVYKNDINYLANFSGNYVELEYKEYIDGVLI